MTLLEAIKQFVKRVSLSDRQEDSVSTSYDNIKSHLYDEDLDLGIDEVFLSGSYERDTILKPIDDAPLDIDIFVVLKNDEGSLNVNSLPDPKSILLKLKRKLDSLPEYTDKVKQNRPCITVQLSDKEFDVLPSFRSIEGYFYIPSDDLKGWQLVPDPATHTAQLNKVNADRNYLVKKVVKAVKYWNIGHDRPYLSIQIEQIAINIFSSNDFTNLEEGTRLWFSMAHLYTSGVVFKSMDAQTCASDRVKKVSTRLSDAKGLYDEGKDAEARKIWKKEFGDEFKIIDTDEVKMFAEAAKSTGSERLQYTLAGGLAMTKGIGIPASGGFYGTSLPSDKL